MRVVLVDDERLAREELRRLLGAHSEVQIVAEARNVQEGVAKIEETRPDLVFLDIRMPDGTGFDVLERLDKAPAVVFTTAFDRYAVQAFEVNALDYLLKPIEPEALSRALERVAPMAPSSTPAATGSDEILTADDHVFVRDGRRCWLVRLGDVRMFESEGNYTRLYFGAERPLVRRSLTQLDARLDPRTYFRANRRQIVNLKKVQSVRGLPAGRVLVLLEAELEVEVSRRRSSELQERLSL